MRGEVATEPVLDDAGAAAMFVAAVRALDAGDPDLAASRCLAVLQYFAASLPPLADGLLGVLAVTQLGLPAATLLPDVVCGALTIMGMAYLHRNFAQAAIAYFAAAEAAMRVRLWSGAKPSGLTRQYYWSCVFHRGGAARAMGRGDILDEVRAALQRGVVPGPADQAVASLEFFRAKAAAEF